MEHLPKDPHILVSSINFLLRDKLYRDLDHICYDFGQDRHELEAKLKEAGYVYNEEQKKFW